MTDPRAFFKLHNGMPENPKVAGLSDAAFRALIELWCYCSRNLTDGRVANAMANRLAGASPLAELVAAGLAIEDGDDIWMHDYLKHQQSKAEVEATRANRRKAGAAGGRAKASALASAKQEPKQTPSTIPGKTLPDTDTDTDNKRGPRKRGTRISNDFKPTADLIEWASVKAPDVDLKAQTERFVNHFLAAPGQKGVKLDWEATWRNWMARQQEWTEERRPQQSGKPSLWDVREAS